MKSNELSSKSVDPLLKSINEQEMFEDKLLVPNYTVNHEKNGKPFHTWFFFQFFVKKKGRMKVNKTEGTLFLHSLTKRYEKKVSN